MLVSTHYMDEAERCHELVYIAYGKVLARAMPMRSSPRRARAISKMPSSAWSTAHRTTSSE